MSERWSDNRLKSHALNVWANYIETGDPAMSAVMAERSGHASQINDLSEDQKKIVARMRQLSIDELKAESVNK